MSYWALAANASERHDVLILRQGIPAGQTLTPEDLGVVSLGSDDGVPSVAADQFADVVGLYARYQLAAGSLLVTDNLQAGPLVTPGRALVSVVVETGDLPADVGAGDDVVLILVADSTCEASPVSVVDAAVTFVAGRPDASSGSGRRTVAVSAEVDDSEVAAVATASKVVVARPNSPEAAAVQAPTPGPNGGCAPSGDATESVIATGDVDDPTEQRPVPTGVTPLEPSDVLVEPGS